jgi:hypothetical protein
MAIYKLHSSGEITPVRVHEKIGKLITEGYPKKQALAIAYSEARQDWRTKHSDKKIPPWLDNLYGKNPISEKTVHKLRKAAPKTFMRMTDEEIKMGVKVKKNPIKNKKQEYMHFIRYSLIPEYEMKKSGYATDFDTIYQILSGRFNKSEAKNFLRYLRQTIIPDSKDAGYYSTAKDLQTGANYIGKILGKPIKKNPVRALKKPKKFSGDWFVDILASGGAGQQWTALASFKDGKKAVDYARAYSIAKNVKTRVYKDSPTK